jgi:hypothetical protein
MRYQWHRMHTKIFEQLQKVKIKCKTAMVCKKKLKMHAVSMAPQAKYDTACTIDERLERPWQPLKGISIKNIYVPELSYPTTKKYINLEGLPKKMFVHALSLTTHARFLRSKIDHISANSKQNSKRLSPVNQGPKGYCLMKKKPRVENLVTLSL